MNNAKQRIENLLINGLTIDAETKIADMIQNETATWNDVKTVGGIDLIAQIGKSIQRREDNDGS